MHRGTSGVDTEIPGNTYVTFPISVLPSGSRASTSGTTSSRPSRPKLLAAHVG